jgi:2-polyprenyl-3-methyl-5-hydroxy-6-metoxy-1,4-benzoquinol methylase
MNNSIQNFIKIEESRTLLSKKKDFKRLYSSYSLENDFLENKNSCELWNELNSKKYNLKKVNPMAYYRNKYVSNNIPNKQINILDIGFGQGYLEKMLNKRKNRLCLYGIDISDKSVNSISKKYFNWNFFIGEISNLHFKDNYFEYVVALEVLEHISPSKLFLSLSEIKRVLKKNGIIIISVPLNEGLEIMLENGQNPNAHTRIYDPSLIKAELMIGGFELIKTKYLFAFHNFFKLKSFFVKLFYKKIKPNNIILIARKK